jgi:hypothetical protein
LDASLGYVEAAIKRMDAKKNVRATAKAAKLRLRITEPSVPGTIVPEPESEHNKNRLRVEAIWASFQHK